MRVSVSKIILLGGVALVLFPLGISKPGLPPTMKADEPAYYLAALSLARDGDLRLELEDLARLPREFPILPVSNMILMTNDAWDTVYYGKPYIYSLAAAPAAGLAGANGMVAFNMLMCAVMIWLGFLHLRRHNEEWLAAAFSVGFFVLSASFAYNYWLHPEVFNMFSVALCLFFAFYRFDQEEGGTESWLRRRMGWAVSGFTPAIWSGAALALGTYNKPMLVAFAMPALYRFFKQGGAKRAAVWVLAFLAMMGVVCGISIALTGQASAYLGVWRTGVELTSFYEMPELAVGVDAAAEVGRSQNSWEWLARIPVVDPSELKEDLAYFFVGRHTGLFPYLPFSLIAIILFVAHQRRSLSRWLTLAATLSIGFYFIIFIPFNWHGGGGFVGNRYFVIAYPAFIFLVTRIRPQWLTGVGYALGVLFLGVVLTTPFGGPVRRPTLQSHVRGKPFALLPLELSMPDRIPGYVGDVESDIWFWGRKDVFEAKDPEFRVHGGTPVEVYLTSLAPLDTLMFRFENPAPWNRMEISLGGDRRVVEFEEPGRKTVVLQPGKPYKVRRHRGKDFYVYRMVVETATMTTLNKLPTGARFFYLGTQSEIEGDVYAIKWRVMESPGPVVAGETFRLPLRVGNLSEHLWRAEGATRIQMSYHWLDESGGVVVREGLRTTLRRRVWPGKGIEVDLEVEAPAEPGRYLLELDAVRQRVSWFSSQKPGLTMRIPIEVVAGRGNSAAE